MLNKNRTIGGVIFEIAYSEDLGHARNKAKKLLIESGKPRPSVVVIFYFQQKGSKEEYQDVDLNFEVLRRHPTNQVELKCYEIGVAWPANKATSSTNTPHIEFGLEELFGNAKRIEEGIQMQRDLDNADDNSLRDILARLPPKLLELLRDKVKQGKTTTLPISYITSVVKRGLEIQNEKDRTDRMTKTKLRQKNEDDDDDEQHFPEA
ncbi:hypothetical protein P7C71_g3270, partial [Lecanoromycetidae sp. Uapishka_2]